MIVSPVLCPNEIVPPEPPQPCDLAILTVIEIELRHVLRAFDIQPQRVQVIDRRQYWETKILSKQTGKQLRIVVGNIARAGLVPAALRTTRFLRDFDPTMVLLVGIAAGCRDDLRIGAVVLPRNILNVSQTEEHATGKKFRTDHHKPSSEVSDMLQSWSVDPAEHAKLAGNILGNPPKFGEGSTDHRGPELHDAPVASDSVIACGDMLVRDAKLFPTLKALDPQVRAFEMESGGMVMAIEDSGRRAKWLQIRGISDFGDEKKHNSWQPYAAAAAASYARLFAENCFNPELITGVQPDAESTLTASQPSVGSHPAPGTSLQVPTSEQPLPAHPLAKQYDEIRQAWRYGRDAGVLPKLRAMCDALDGSNAPGTLQARILRFTARLELELEKNPVRAKELDQQAAQVGDSSRLISALIAAESNPVEGAKILAGPTTLEEWNQRILLLLVGKSYDDALAELDQPPEGVGPDVESRRLRALALMTKKQLIAAKEEFQKIDAKHLGVFGIKLTGAMLRYFEAISPAAPAAVFEPTPLPVVPEFIKRDERSLIALDQAEREFRELLGPTAAGSALYLELQHWRLCALAGHPARRAQAEELCAQLLQENPGDPVVLQIAEVHRLPVDRDTEITALAKKLNISL